MKHYEDLKGASGQRVFYRAERFNAADLFEGPAPRVEVDGAPLALQNLSMSGLALLAGRDQDALPEAGSEVNIRLLFNSIELHRGAARIVRHEQTPRGTRLGINLTGNHIDVRQLLERHEEAVLRHEVDSGLQEDISLVPAEYRLLCADMLHLLRRYKTILDRADKQHPTRTSAANDSYASELLNLCEDRILPEWRELWYRANALVEPIMGQPAVFQAIKNYTELVLVPEFSIGPLWERCYEKPLGYPGDYLIMNYIYSRRSHGDSAYAKLLHRLCLDGTECIANRMTMIQKIIAEVVAKGPKGKLARIANLGCGTAQEIANYLHAPQLPRPVQFTLIDQDQDALGFAYQQSYPRVVELAGSAQVTCLHTEFAQLMRAGVLFQKLPPQDMIYSAGLIDYLRQPLAKSLVHSLYEQLAPGGCLVIANLHQTPKSTLWIAEFICDWELIYRSEADMRDLAEGLNVKSFSTQIDPTGRVILLRIEKPE